MSDPKPLLIISRSDKDADRYARSNGIANYIHIRGAESLRGIERGLEYVWVSEYIYLISSREFNSISEMLNIREHKEVR